MEKRILGNTNIEISPVGLGCMGLSHAFGTPLEKVEAAEKIQAAYDIKEGKIRSRGISETGEDYLRRANAVCPVTAIQNRYSMIARDYEPLFPVLKELDIALVAFSPLGNGFLSGAYNASDKFAEGVDFRSRMPQYTKEGFEAGKPLFDYLAVLGKEKNATPGQLSLAWMMCKKPWIVPIPGSRKKNRLRQNLGAGDVVLTAEEIAQIDRMLDGIELPVFGKKR